MGYYIIKKGATTYLIENLVIRPWKAQDTWVWKKHGGANLFVLDIAWCLDEMVGCMRAHVLFVW